MDKKEIITEIDHWILQRLFYGCEVFVINKKNDPSKRHWFENIGADGFYTTENQGKPARYISIDEKAWLDFEKIKPYLTMLKERRDED